MNNICRKCYFFYREKSSYPRCSFSIVENKIGSDYPRFYMKYCAEKNKDGRCIDFKKSFKKNKLIKDFNLKLNHCSSCINRIISPFKKPCKIKCYDYVIGKKIEKELNCEVENKNGDCKFYKKGKSRHREDKVK